jgi:LuxR family quorum sensing-dependent transcriptional regulator
MRATEHDDNCCPAATDRAGVCDPFRRRLSADQRAVLTLLATGLTTAQVARQLCVSVDEVLASVNAIRRVLGARSKLEAVCIALRDRLIQIPAA